MYKMIPEELLLFINNHQSTGYNCSRCTFSCCYESGFALRENVDLIYRKYNAGLLIRSDYKFKDNLSYDDFIRIYFDVISFSNLNLSLYFPRHVAYDDVALVIDPVPDQNYWDYRHRILSDPINENKGCIFLNNKLIADDAQPTHCILHDPSKTDFIYEKPIDCILLSCNSLNRVVPLSNQDTETYFKILSKHFGESKDVV